ncbi:MAG: hypothetical protein FJW23_09305 [Acidimicrobiia bacterium]|nr:hypothetical protein [Acidimicrobiia bacterium]
MRPRRRAIVSVLALLCGFLAAPYTHVHRGVDAVHDPAHPHGRTLVHTHASPHAHGHQHGDDSRPAPADTGGGDEQIWSVASFVFQSPASPGSAPLCVAAGRSPLPWPTGVLVRLDFQHPRVHGPPVGSPSGLRAPPSFPPASA